MAANPQRFTSSYGSSKGCGKFEKSIVSVSAGLRWREAFSI